MANNSSYQRIRLVGELLAPAIVNKPVVFIRGCKVTITREPQENEKGYLPYPRRIAYGKLKKGERRAPTVRTGFMGYIVVDLTGNITEGEKKLPYFLALDAIGSQQKEGMGRIQWLEKKVVSPVKKTPQGKKFTIRKGLGYYPKPMLTTIKGLLLHDFVHTPKHDSKIYQEVEITSNFIREACKNHHSENHSNNWLVEIIKQYDAQAAFRMRKIPTEVISRYDKENGEVDCQALAEEIAEKQNTACSLYDYVYQSKTLARFYESMTYARNDLRKHLLVAVNLLINDFKKGKIKVENNKLKLVSIPTTEIKEETKKFLSESKVLKRIYSSKKELVRQTVEQTNFQEETVESENRSKNDSKKTSCDEITKEKK